MSRLAPIVFLLAAGSLAHAGPARRDVARAKAAEADKAGLPHAAAEAWAPVYADALKDGAWAEAVEALVAHTDARAQSGNTEDALAFKIRTLEAAATTAPTAIKPVLLTLIAHAYREYLDAHSHTLRDRTELNTDRAATPAVDSVSGVQYLTLGALHARASAAYANALSCAPALLSTPLRDYARLITPGNLPAARQPTLFDFLAADAIGFYTEPRRLLATPADAVVLRSDSPALGTVDEFLAWHPAGPASDPVLHLVSLFQQRLLAHARDTDAFADADLARLAWAADAIPGDAATDRVHDALRAFARAHAHAPIAAEAQARLATALHAANRPAEAHAVALAGEIAAPDSLGGKLCADIRRRLEHPSLSLTGERVWNAPWPRLAVTHRNASAVRFRVVKADWKKFLERDRGRPEWLSEKEKNELYAAPAAREWSAPLPETKDFADHTERLPVPEDLAPGFYFLLASDADDLSGKTAPVVYSDFWVSRLAMTVAPADGGLVAGRIHEALTGEPIAGATVTAWTLDRSGEREKTGETTTTGDGAWSLPAVKNRPSLLLATTPDGHALASMSEYAGLPERRPVAEHNRIAFFTDRAAYRPGQTLRFKGVVVRADPEHNTGRPLTDRRVTVVLDDANGREVARVQATTNAFGAFDGAFTTPTDRLPGVYQLHTVGNENGRAAVRVEEYKRPTFEVALDAPSPGAALGGPIAVSGKALAYTGVPVDGAAVSWRVTRTARAPRWCWWRNPEPAREVASGHTGADARGAFAIHFTAELPEGRAADGLMYAYEVTADVTDSAGETRATHRTVSIGRTDFTAELDATAATGPAALTVSLKSNAGIACAGVAGKVTLRKLQEPASVHRAPLETERWSTAYRHAAEAIAASGEDDDTGGDRSHADLSDPRRWEPGEVVATLPFTTDATGAATLAAASLPPGHYRAALETADAKGRPVKARTLLRVLPTAGDTLGLKTPFVSTADRTSAQPGDTVTVSWGTGYDTGRALVEILRPGVAPEVFRTPPGKTRQGISVPITEADRGSIAVRISQVRENRFYHAEHRVDVPFTEDHLAITWEKFTDRLTPGTPVTWTAKVAGADGRPVAASVAATLYDASLDPFMALTWPADFGLRRDRRPDPPMPTFLNTAKSFSYAKGQYIEPGWNAAQPVAPAWKPPYAIAPHWSGPMMMYSRAEGAPSATGKRAPQPPPPVKPAAETPDFDAMKPRAKLDESAFWFPHVTTGADGLATFTFTAPEALTRWRGLVFAHDKSLRAGRLECSAITALDLMVKPALPRFLREGDTAELPVRVINRTDKPITGVARLAFADLDTGATCDAALGNTTPDRPFVVAAHTTVTLGWKVTIPDGGHALRYTVKAVCATGGGDGETGAIPVLSGRIHVTESVAGVVIGPGETTVRLPALIAAGTSPTLRHGSLTVATVARPAWCAVQALPYLMEYPHACSEQVFHRFYANALAAAVTAKVPALRETFGRWRGTPALNSPLALPPGIALDETPWVHESDGDSARRRRVGLLFDEAAMKMAGEDALAKLAAARSPDGGWSWFPGAGESSPWVTRTIVLGLGRLRALGAGDHTATAMPAITVLDKWMQDRRSVIATTLVATGCTSFGHLNDEVAHHLHSRSYFLKEKPFSDAVVAAAYAGDLAECREYWPTLDFASQARLALCLGAYGDTATPAAIVRSLRERAIVDPQRGMRWNDGRSPKFWQPWVAPVETQALMVEVFDTVAHDRVAADACRLALLDMKRTTDWGTTTATAEACHALLMRGDDWLAGDAPLSVTAGSRALKAAVVEPGTGATEVTVPAGEITPALGVIKVVKVEAGPAWVCAHWSYFEAAAKVKPSAGTGLVVTQALFKKILTCNGPELVALTDGRAHVGDEVVVRVTLTSDRDLDFVHLKTARPAALEPGVVVSGYKYAGGLGWYEAVRDTTTHRFIEHLPAGTHVFEFTTHADRRGVYHGGITEARCLYAPDFAAHTEAPVLTVE